MSLDSRLLEAALAYAALGWPVIPLHTPVGEGRCSCGLPKCDSIGKHPRTRHGRTDGSRDPQKIREWWERWPDANIGVVTGKESNLAVIDLDRRGEVDGVAAAETLYGFEIEGPSQQTGGGGLQAFCRRPDRETVGSRSGAGSIGPGIELKADGGYVAVPPSLHVSGHRYMWIESVETELPPLPDWAVERAEAPSQAPPDGNTIPSGYRNSTLASLGGTMRRAGMTRPEILAALHRINQDRCQPPLPSSEVDRIASSVSRYDPDEVTVALVENHYGQMFDESGEEGGPTDPGLFPEELLNCEGLLAEIVEFNSQTAFKRQPILALAAAIALVGTITGRKVQDPFGTRTNVYCMGLCRTGGGKEHARQVNKEILVRAGLEKRIGPEGIASHAGVISAIHLQPALLFQIDEIGRFLKTTGDHKRSPHLYKVIDVLMKLYSSSRTFFCGDAYSDANRNVVIDQPHPCVYGTSVPRSFYESITAENLTDGFMSRVLVFETNDHDPPMQDGFKVEVPASIIEKVRWWGEYVPPGNLSAEHPEPYTAEYEEGAHEVIVDLETRARKAREHMSEAMRALWTRTMEKARKLALIHACSRKSEPPVIGEKSAQWATAMSEYLTRLMSCRASEWVAENPFEADRKRILRAIREAGRGGLTQTQLYRKSRYLKQKDRTEIIESLQQTNEIAVRREPTGGAPKTIYVAK